jgi:hypothetical protein
VVAADAVLVVAVDVALEVAVDAVDAMAVVDVSVATKVRPRKSWKRPWSCTSATRSSYANGPWMKRFPISTPVSF